MTPHLSVSDILTMVGMVITILVSVGGAYMAVRSKLAAHDMRMSTVERDQMQLWEAIRTKADKEYLSETLKDIKQAVNDLQKIMMAIGGDAIKKNLDLS